MSPIRSPLVDRGSRLLGVVLVFLDVTAGRRLQAIDDELRNRTVDLDAVNRRCEDLWGCGPTRRWVSIS